MRILKTGIASVQDSGRTGFRSLGIGRAGAMDPSAARIGQLLVGNSRESAYIEFASGEFLARFSHKQLITLTGKGFSARINEHELPFWQPFAVQAGDELRLVPQNQGWAYLSVHGGVKTKPVLGSRSTNLAGGFGGFEGRLLKAGDMLPLSIIPDPLGTAILHSLENSSHPRRIRLSPSSLPDYGRTTIRCMRGPELDEFTPESLRLFVSAPFERTALANRMGYRIKGEPIKTSRSFELISSAVVPGTIQVSPDGQLLILMADAQTAGGYPRIGQVIAPDLPILAQLPPGSPFRFQWVDSREAEDLWLQQEKQFRSLQQDYTLQFT